MVQLLNNKMPYTDVFLKRHKYALLKASIYIALLIAFVKFYLYDELLTFLKGNTSFSSGHTYVDQLPLPAMSLCFEGLKKSALERYGYHSTFSISLDAEENYLKKFNMTQFEVFNKSIFHLDEDFNASIGLHSGMNLDLHFGQNFFGPKLEKLITVRNVFTTFGTCYLIDAKFLVNVTDVTWFRFSIFPSPTMDKDVKMFLTFTSNTTWQGLYFYSWPFFEVPKLTIPMDPTLEIISEIIPNKVHFKSGQKDVQKCLEEVMLSIECDRLCFPLSFNLLDNGSACDTFAQSECMFHGIYEAHREIAFGNCIRPETTMTYRLQSRFTRPSLKGLKSSEVRVWLRYSSDDLTVMEEVPVLGLASFIGSIGGSLGLFLGFSCFTYFSKMVDKIKNFV